MPKIIDAESKIVLNRPTTNRIDLILTLAFAEYIIIQCSRSYKKQNLSLKILTGFEQQFKIKT